MASWDTADLLDKVKRYARRPTADEGMEDTDWYALMSEAQNFWMGQIALHAPEVLFTAPTLMTTSDGGYTYVIPGLTTYPMAVEIRASRSGQLLVPGAEWDDGADYTIEADGTVRIPSHRQRSFAEGPYARFIPQSTVISDSVAPVLKPAHACILIVYGALERYETIGRLGDPSYWKDRAQEVWAGDPQKPGTIGLLGELKLQHRARGQNCAIRSWWYSPDLQASR
jgi:hypothetical protein